MIQTAFGIVIFLTLVGCNYNHVHGDGKVNATQKVTDLGVLANLDFQSVELAVLGPQCLRCHSPSGGNQGGLNLDGYLRVRASLGQIYYRAIEKKDMPPSALTSSQYDLLKAWLEAGAPEKNGGAKSSASIQGPINWKVIKEQVLKSSCLDCHSGKNPDAGLDFEQVDVVRKNINSIFDSAIIKMSMPLEPYSALSESEKQALMKWISQGMPL